jgi:hypothetical protein
MGWDVPDRALLALLSEERDGSFGPDEIAAMTTAFDQILHDLDLTDRKDPIIRMVAKLVIELVRSGERDPEVLRKRVVGRSKLKS